MKCDLHASGAVLANARAGGLIRVFPALLLLVAVQVGCRRVQTPAPNPSHVKALARSGKFEAASAEVEEGLRRSQDGSPEHWSFIIEEANLVYNRDGAKAARPLFEPEPPARPEFASQRARRKVLQGWIEYADGNYPLAEKLWDEGLQIAKPAQDHEQIAGLEFSLAQLYSVQKRFPEAEEQVRDANRHTLVLHDKHLTAYGLNTLAIVLSNQSRFEEALPLAERVYETTDAKESDDAFTALCNLGWCLYKLGEFDRSFAAFRKVEELGSHPGSAKIPQPLYGDMGNIYKDRGDYGTARGYYLKALQLSEERGARAASVKWLGDLADISIRTQDYAGAETYNRKALSLAKVLGDKSAELHALCSAAEILNGRGDFLAAEKLFQDVSRTEADDRAPALLAHSGLAKIYAAHGNDALADREYQAAINIVENGQSSLKQDDFKLSFLNVLHNVHQDYIDFLMSHGKNQRALEIAESSRARILQGKLGNSAKITPVPASAYQRLARESGSVLLSYSIGPGRSYVWVITGSGIVSYPLPPQEEINSLVERYRAFVENMHDPLNTEDPSGPKLYQMVLAPALDRVPVGSRIVISADQGLHALNFETLPVPAPKKHYFLEDATITVTPSLNLLTGHASAQIREPRLLLIGDPDSNDEHFPKLQNAAREISLVEGHFPPSGVTSYRESQAVPAVYDKSPLNGFSYIHFTAHATMDREVPLDSSIILSGDNDSNKLTAREVLKHPINAQLVTISACRGAGAKTYSGEGLVGFMWAFFQSGAQSIIAGLWDVSDDSTTQLMDTLYGGIMRGMSPADALRNAKLNLIGSNSTWSRPYYWAPFQLYSREILRRANRAANLVQSNRTPAVTLKSWHYPNPSSDRSSESPN